MEEDGESELSDYPGEEDMEDMGEDDIDGDLGETGEVSPTQTSPDRDSNAHH